MSAATPHSLSFSLCLPSSLPCSRSLLQTGYLRANARRLVSTRVGNSSVVTGQEASTSSSLQAPSSFNSFRPPLQSPLGPKQRKKEINLPPSTGQCPLPPLSSSVDYVSRRGEFRATLHGQC